MQGIKKPPAVAGGIECFLLDCWDSSSERNSRSVDTATMVRPRLGVVWDYLPGRLSAEVKLDHGGVRRRLLKHRFVSHNFLQHDEEVLPSHCPKSITMKESP